MRNPRSFFLILMLIVMISMIFTNTSTEKVNRDSNVFEMMNFFPLSIILGTPLTLFGAMIYYVMKDNGRNACLITSSLFLAGFVSVVTTVFMPVDSTVLGFALALIAFGVFVAMRIYKDLKEKNYL